MTADSWRQVITLAVTVARSKGHADYLCSFSFKPSMLLFSLALPELGRGPTLHVPLRCGSRHVNLDYVKDTVDSFDPSSEQFVTSTGIHVTNVEEERAEVGSTGHGNARWLYRAEVTI